VKKAIIDTWKTNMFGRMGLSYINEEVFVGSHSEGGGIVDILAKETKKDKFIIIEVKGPRTKGKYAWGQLKYYELLFEKYNNDNVYCIIVSYGYPYGLDDLEFLLIGYVIEDCRIAFIPWFIII
jgi:hypothetical protein